MFSDPLSKASLLLASAESELNREAFDAAVHSAGEALRLARSLGSDGDSVVAEAIRVSAEAYTREGKYDETVRLAESELDRFRKAGNSRCEASLLLALASARCEQGVGCQEAVERARRARDIFRAEGTVKLEASAWSVLTNLYLKKPGDQRRSAQEAIGAALAARELFRRVTDRRGEAVALHGLAAARAAGGDPRGALEASKEALAAFRELGLRTLEAAELTTAAKLQVLLGRPRDGLALAEEAQQLLQEMHSGQGWEADALEVVVQALLALGKLEEATERAQEAVTRFSGAQDKVGEAAALHTLARVRLEAKLFGGALQSAEAALAVCEGLGDKRGEANVARTIARVHIARRGPGAAAMAEKAEVLSHSSGDETGSALALRTLAEAYLKADDVEQALAVAERERAACEMAGDEHGEAGALMFAFDVQCRMRSLREAMPQATRARAILRAASDAEGEAAVWLKLSEAQLANSEFWTAAESSQRARALYGQAGRASDELAAMLQLARVHLSDFWQSRNGDVDTLDRWKTVDAALATSSEVAARARESGNKRISASALYALAQAHTFSEAWTDAANAAEGSAQLSREIGEEGDEAAALVLGAEACLRGAMFKRAAREAAKALALYKKRKDQPGEGFATQVLDHARAAGQEPDVPLWFGPSPAMANDLAALGLDAKQGVRKTFSSKGLRSQATTRRLVCRGAAGFMDDMPLMDDAGVRGRCAVRPRSALVG